ncbi:hypothetical protein EKPJFOCH_0847 [Methylobacterium thuringiense]|uniref:MarR family transcriptional regulator n=1 Tax=Methylobacterium thuringiense TaxID=1003091 RepID=A0ABQ4THW3_9HYPH|nr:hypothetical protein EKPJFOCH_0847 [Methylobacterium thuringiense]
MDIGIVRLSPFAPSESGTVRRSGRPPDPALLEVVRGLIETTTLPYREIARRTGVSAAAISRHAGARGWCRPEGPFREERLTPEGRRRERRGALAGRILRRAEELVSIVEMDPAATVAQLARAARFLTLAERLDSPAPQPRPRRRRRRIAKTAPNQSPTPDDDAT